VAFGASVTQATPAVIPGYGLLVRAVEAYGKHFGDTSIPNYPGVEALQGPYTARPYGWSPIQYFVADQGGPEALRRITFMGSYFPRNEKTLGSYQVTQMLDGDAQQTFNTASLIVGVDAFYWDAIANNCGYGNDEGVEPLIVRLISEAKEKGITLVLGNVPHEVPTNVKIDSDRTGLQIFWWAPKPQCADSINTTLEANCTAENGCYIVGLKGLTDDLNCGWKLPVGKSKYGLYELRPDGVHLSDKGAEFVSDQIRRAMVQNPPKCQE
jgi:hypothetical protein